MHSKNNNKSQSYIKGLRPFSNTIPKTLKKYLKKGGYNYSNIIDNWTKMVDKKISDVSYPTTIKMGKEMKDGTLVLNVLHGKELEIEYAKHEIVEKINSFFGYNCISCVKLKIVQEEIVKKKESLPKIKNIKKINQKMDKIENKQLKMSLKNFLNAFNEQN